MATYLNQLINPASMSHDIKNGLIRVQKHPTQPLDIYNYTERAQFSKKWNKATTLSRGLIVNRETGEIVARPFPKFFNYGELPVHQKLSLEEPVVVTDKMDGSLGILYWDLHNNLAIATRGSFASDQALHATELLRRKYPAFAPRHGVTYLFEIVYPENRIVVNYQGLDDLVLLGAVDIRSGSVFGPEFDVQWPGLRTEVFPARTLSEALSLPLRPGKEGLVVRSLMDGTMVKIKQDDYVQLHRVVTNLNPKTIWERIMEADLTLPPEVSRREKVLDGLPDEFYEDVWATASMFFTRVSSRIDEAYTVFKKLSPLQHGDLEDRQVRAIFAQRVKDLEPWLRSALWLVYDNKHAAVRELIWKQIQPRGDSK